MSNELEQFKTIFLSRMIKQINLSGTPPAKHWPIPDSFKQNSTIMEALLSKKGYQIYGKLSKDEQELSLDYVENFGPKLAEILECQLFEDWDKKKIVICDKKKEELKTKYNLDI